MCEPSCIKYTGGSSFTCSDKATARAVAKRTYESAVELFAMLCKQYNLNPTADGVIISHREGHSRGIASNHGDPEHLWNGLGMGYTMDGFRKAVKAKMNGSSNTDHSGTSGLQASALKNLSEADVIAKVGPLFTADQKASGILASVSLAQFMAFSGIKFGFDATNDIFAENAWYFRNALVRANYNDLKNGVHETTEYLELFLRNLLLDEKNELHNRTMHISGRFAEVDIERVKVDIKSREVDIESTKVDIRNKLLSFSDTISEKTINHTVEIFSKCGKENCFGRTIVEEITGLKPSRASKLIKLLVDSEVIVPVTGHGKGKYRFQ